MLQLNNFIGLRADLRVMSDKEKCMAGFVKLTKNLHNPLLILSVEVSGWLVRQKDLRLIDQGARDADPLLLAAREFGRIMAHPLFKPDFTYGLSGLFPIGHTVKILGQHHILQGS